MAWETRGNNRYYYRKQRIGERVISEYVGAGFLAEMLADRDNFDRETRRLESQTFKNQRELITDLDRELKQASDQAIWLIRAVLLLAGYHPHKGQWRKHRE